MSLRCPQPLCSLLWLAINPHLVLFTPMWVYLLAAEEETLACLPGHPNWWLLTFYILLQYLVLQFFRICFRKTDCLSEISAKTKEKKTNQNSIIGFKVLRICSHFVYNKTEMLNVFSFPIIHVEPRDVNPHQG